MLSPCNVQPIYICKRGLRRFTFRQRMDKAISTGGSVIVQIVEVAHAAGYVFSNGMRSLNDLIPQHSIKGHSVSILEAVSISNNVYIAADCVYTTVTNKIKAASRWMPADVTSSVGLSRSGPSSSHWADAARLPSP